MENDEEAERKLRTRNKCGKIQKAQSSKLDKEGPAMGEEEKTNKDEGPAMGTRRRPSCGRL